MTSSSESDVLVIGGGICGTATAFHLALQGDRVILLERGDIASEASGINPGGLGGFGWGYNPNLQSYLTAGGFEIFKSLQLDMGYDIEFHAPGGLQAIHTANNGIMQGTVYSSHRQMAITPSWLRLGKHVL